MKATCVRLAKYQENICLRKEQIQANASFPWWKDFLWSSIFSLFKYINFLLSILQATMNIIDGPGGIYRHKHHSVLHMCSRNIRLYKCTVVCQRLTYKNCIMTALVLAILLVVTSGQVHERPHMSNYMLFVTSVHCRQSCKCQSYRRDPQQNGGRVPFPAWTLPVHSYWTGLSRVPAWLMDRSHELPYLHIFTGTPWILPFLVEDELAFPC